MKTVDSTDPTGGAGDSVVVGLENWMTHHFLAVGFAFLLVVLAASLVVHLVVKMLKGGGGSSSNYYFGDTGPNGGGY
ncbi:MAG: hypothetical protein JWO22_2025 [Frankiales bacterium]|nr:hypothetical protein [Frankiales bacterium]